MYLKNLVIENMGPIDQVTVEAQFHDNGMPKPLVVVGQNGSGKSILLAQVTDALYELGGSLFDDVRKYEGQGYKFYKICGGLNIKTGKSRGCALLRFEDANKFCIEYYDKTGNYEQEYFKTILNDFKLSQEKINNYKKVTHLDDEIKEKLQKEWLSGAYFFQPAYRYEEPFWKTEEFFDSTRFKDRARFANQLNKPIEIISSTKINKAFLMDVVLDQHIRQNNTVDKEIWGNINRVLRLIKKRPDIRLGIGPRGKYRVALVEQTQQGLKEILPSIDGLSLGESLLLNLFINIIRHGDNPPKKCEEIEGVVIVDEIDVHLHCDLQFTVLPKLIKSFPKIQFIITSHSALFLLGMRKEFGEDGFDIINMPDGNRITVEKFTEFEKAYNILQETEKFERDIDSAVQKSKKPIVFVEGKYDQKYILKAAEVLDKKEIIEKVSLYNADGFGGLNMIWKHYSTQISQILEANTLLLYDCDMDKVDKEKGRLFIRVVPRVDAHILKKGIENLFPNDLVMKAREMNKAFVNYTGRIIKEVGGIVSEEQERYEINEHEKGRLCDWICNNAADKDFLEFEKIFQIIEKTVLA
jgi:hypothetical protein